MHYRSAGQVRLPIVIRIPFGGGIGAVEHHSESPEAYFAHTAGLKVVACSNPADAYWMIQQAIASDDPVLLLRAQAAVLGEGRGRHARPRPEPLHAAAGASAPGTDVTVVAYGPMVPHRAGRRRRPRPRTAAAGGHRPAHRCRRWTSAPVCESVRRPAGCVVVHEAPANLGHGRRDRGPGHRGVLLLAGGAGAAGRRLRHARTRPSPARGGVPARPRPGARRRRPLMRSEVVTARMR